MWLVLGAQPARLLLPGEGSAGAWEEQMRAEAAHGHRGRVEARGCSRGRPQEARGTRSFRRELSPAGTLMLDFPSPAWKGVNVCYSQPPRLRMFVTRLWAVHQAPVCGAGLEGTPQILSAGIP